MNKGELIDQLMKDEDASFESKSQAERALNAVIEAIINGLEETGNVQLVGFGTFEVKERKARIGRNPRTGEEIKIPASKTVGFRPGSKLKDRV